METSLRWYFWLWTAYFHVNSYLCIVWFFHIACVTFSGDIPIARFFLLIHHILSQVSQHQMGQMKCLDLPENYEIIYFFNLITYNCFPELTYFLSNTRYSYLSHDYFIFRLRQLLLACLLTYVYLAYWTSQISKLWILLDWGPIYTYPDNNYPILSKENFIRKESHSHVSGTTSYFIHT